MAKKKKTTAVPSGTFDVGSFRRGEEASMAGYTPPAAANVSYVDEQILAKERAAAMKAASAAVDLRDYPVVDPIKQAIAQQTTQLSISVDTALSQAESDLDAVLAEIAAENALAEAEEAAAAAAAATAAAQMAEGDILKEEGDKLFAQAFAADPFATYSSLSPSLKAVINTQMGDESNAAFMSAFAVLSSVGVEGLMGAIDEIRKLYPKISSEDALLLLKYDKRFNEPYLKRFEGNRLRMQNGLPPLDDAEYLSNEQAYEKTFKSYGLTQFTNRAYYAQLIGENQPPADIATKVSLGFDKIINGPVENLNALKKFFDITDIVAYALSPKTMLPQMKQKVLAAQIGGQALAQGLGTSLEAKTFTGAEAAGTPTNITRGTIGVNAMMAAGTTEANMEKLAADVARVLPTGEKLSSIYAKGYKQYGQLEAEKDIYLSNVEAERAKLALEAREKAEWSGESGILKSQRRATGGLI